MNWERDWNYNDWCHTIHQDVHFNSLILKQALGKGTLDDVCVFWVCDCRRRKDDACNVQLDLLGDWRLTVGLVNLKNVLVPLKITYVIGCQSCIRKLTQGNDIRDTLFNQLFPTPPPPLKSAFNADHGFVSSAYQYSFYIEMSELLTSDLFHANLRWNIFISTPFIENQ